MAALFCFGDRLPLVIASDSEAIQRRGADLDCFVVSRLAMTMVGPLSDNR
jgi:hypothetical protein